jgi:hypothetical protein
MKKREFNKVIRNIQKQWQVGVASSGYPYHGGLLLDPNERILGWLRVCHRNGPKADLLMDVGDLVRAMPFVLASGRPLVLVVSSPEGLRYAVWQPGLADFRAYRSDQEEEEPWYAVIPASALKPLGRSCPEELGKNLGVRRIRVPAGRSEAPKRQALQRKTINVSSP